MNGRLRAQAVPSAHVPHLAYVQRVGEDSLLHTPSSFMVLFMCSIGIYCMPTVGEAVSARAMAVSQTERLSALRSSEDTLRRG